MRYLGWISSISLVLCGIPELYSAYVTGNVTITWGLIILWFLGEFTGLIYVIPQRKLPLITNYFLNSIVTGTLLYMKIAEVS